MSVGIEMCPPCVLWYIFLNCLFPPHSGHIKTLQSIQYRPEKPTVQFARLSPWSLRCLCCFQLSRRRLNCIERQRDCLIAWHEIVCASVIFHIMRLVSLPAAHIRPPSKPQRDCRGSLSHLKLLLLGDHTPSGRYTLFAMTNKNRKGGDNRCYMFRS